MMEHETGKWAHERRMEPRHPIRREATLYCDAVGEPVLVTNISAYGAMLVGRSFPLAGTYVSLPVAGRDMMATVAWCKAEKCGLLFHERIDPATFAGDEPLPSRQAGHPQPITYI